MNRLNYSFSEALRPLINIHVPLDIFNPIVKYNLELGIEIPMSTRLIFFSLKSYNDNTTKDIKIEYNRLEKAILRLKYRISRISWMN